MGGGSSQAAANGVVTNVYYDVSTGLIYFTGANSGKGGNTVIALKNGENILWSWHIWMVTSPKADEKYGTGDYYGNTVTMMPYNLGAVNTANIGVAGNAFDDGLLYQWGRKDPFLGAKGYANDNPKAGTDYYAATDFTYDGAGPVTPVAAYQDPITFYKSGSSPYDWSDTRYNNLWGNGRGTTYADWDGNNNKEYGTKTLFDPCPPGYKVATSNKWSTNFASVSDIIFNKGYAFKYRGTFATSFYSASGYRNRSDGSLSSVGTIGCCWSSSPNESGSRYGGYLRFASSTVYPLYNLYRASGFPVRCAREKNE
jgi:hypothetical protein